ncbi:hypothetical protein BB559_004211 [Furculomyces boomerangus]|uniref:glycerophosphodiester phosphodiesterase n=2 Tax=Harpellales TaxID=61421 RepID=A0A2T9YG20_9FUNG|nr:hypothetical protein BB559_004211 [Furculomyces boomerangus]PVZ98856.1 hypothetical protein BB558_005139 [Smittium angustum]
MRLANFSIFSSLAIIFSGSVASRNVWNTLDGNPTRLVGHRGEKAFMPEHSLGSYNMAALLSVDYIEPDLCLTKDGELVVIHNEWLGDTTNIANLTQFADRKKQLTFNGKYTQINRTDWFTFDFTMAELETITVTQSQAYPWRPQYYNTIFKMLSFDQYLDTVESLSATLNRTFGIIPELKSPELFNTYHPSANGRYFEDKLIETLTKRGYTQNQPPPKKPLMKGDDLLNQMLNVDNSDLPPSSYKVATIQSFDPECLQYLSTKTKIPLVNLDSTIAMYYTPGGLDYMAKFASIFSMAKQVLITEPALYFELSKISYNATQIAALGGFLSTADLVKECHKRGIELSPYTFYDSRQSLANICDTVSDPRIKFCPKNSKEEQNYMFNLGIDYLFVENVFESQSLRLAFDYEIRYSSENCAY